MGIFDSIKNAIFGHASQAAAPAASAAPAAAPSSAAAAPPPAAAKPGMTQAGLTSQLTALSAKSAQKLNWQTSIVDLLKLLGMDSSMTARKSLAGELHYTGDTNDSATMNVWLIKEVMSQLAANGGKVPANLMH